MSTKQNEQAPSQEDKAILYLTCGYSNLISNNYQDAIDDYQKASKLISNSNDPGINFLISFGSLVACDHLHLPQLAQSHVNNIRNLINNNFQDKEESQEYTSQNYQAIIDSLTSLAQTSVSEETKNLLTSFISEIFPSEPSSLTSFVVKQGLPCSLHNTIPCKSKSGLSFWKKAENLAKRIARTWDKIYKIYKQMREVEDDLKSRFEKEEK